jgi:phosphonate transport system substrate-binding protein
MGERESFFGRVTFTGRHQESIRKVVNGEVDAAAIDSHVLGVEQLRDPELGGQLRTIASFGPSTIPLVVATAGVPATLQGHLTAALCELGADRGTRSLLASGLIRRFTPIDDLAYDDIRHKVAAVDQRRAPSSSAGTR